MSLAPAAAAARQTDTESYGGSVGKRGTEEGTNVPRSVRSVLTEACYTSERKGKREGEKEIADGALAGIPAVAVAALCP